MKKRILLRVLCLCMVATLLPTAVFAAEPCANHTSHDDTCSFVEAVEEIPCDKGCAETDENGTILHTVDCAYYTAVEGAPCDHSCELCHPLDSNSPDAPPQVLGDPAPEAPAKSVTPGADEEESQAHLREALGKETLTEDEEAELAAPLEIWEPGAAHMTGMQVMGDGDTPVLTAGRSVRTALTTATVSFTSNTAGQYYYTVVAGGAEKPAIDTAGAGTDCDTTEQTIYLTGVGTGERDVYIVVKDQDDNVSADNFKITIPAHYAPTVFGSGTKSILAHGTPIRIVDGTTVNYTNILYDKDGDGIIGDTEYLKIGDTEPSADGYFLQNYNIYGGMTDGDTKITIEGGFVGNVSGGHVNAGDPGASGGGGSTQNVSIVMSGGSVNTLTAARGGYGAVGGEGKTVSISISGGTVRGVNAGDNPQVDLAALIDGNSTKILSISGGTIAGVAKAAPGSTFTITGGTIRARIESGSEQPTNGSEPVYKTVLTFKNGSSGRGNALVTSLTTDAGYSYGTTGVQTDSGGAISIYLPEGTKTTAGTIGSENYFNADGISTTAAGTARGELARTAYSYNTPASILKNGVTAAVSFAPASPQEEGTSVTASVTLSGTATSTGVHTINLSSAAAGLTGRAQSMAVTAGQTSFAALDTYTFTLPPGSVNDMRLMHTAVLAPSSASSAVYGNGMPIKVVAGTTDNYTNILYDIDGDGTIEDTEYLKIGDTDPTAAGYDLSRYNILNGMDGGDGVITVEGGYVNDVRAQETSTCLTINMSGGSVGRLIGVNLSGSGANTVSMTISGGTVRGTSDSPHVDLWSGIPSANAVNNSLTITGGTINGNVRVQPGTTVKITGGTFTGSMVDAVPTNNAATNIYKTSLTFMDGSTPKANANVTALTTEQGYTYGMTDVETDSSGTIYIYLPEGTKTTGGTIDSENYYNADGITTTTDGTASGTLRKVVVSYDYNTPADKTVNGVTATATFDKAAPQAAGELITATVTLTGTATAAGTHAVGLSSETIGAITAPATVTKTVAANTAMTASDTFEFTFTMPASAVSDLTLTHTFVPAAPSCTFSFDGTNAGKLMGATTAMEYSLSGGTDWAVCTADMALTVANITMANGIQVRIAAASPASTGEIQTIAITKAATPNLVAIQPDRIGGKGSIPMTAAHEYKLSIASTWTTASGVTPLALGSYHVRVKAAGTALASDAQTLTINAFDPSRETTPGTTFSATGPDSGTLSGVTDGMKYSTDGTSWTDISSSTDINLTGLSACTLSVVKKGNGTTTTDSSPQTITITKAAIPITAAGVACTTSANNDGKLTGVTAAMEYKKADGVWANGIGSDITGLVNGSYYVRVKATGTVLASGNQSVTINAYLAPTTFNITFDPNGGSVSPTSATTGADGKLASLPTPTRSGSYSFDGWFTAASGGTKVMTSAVFSTDSTIYAHWTYTGGGESYTPPTYDVPVSGSKSSVNAQASVSNGTVTVTVSARQLDTVLNDADTTGKIEIHAGLNKSIAAVTIRTTVIESISGAAQDENKAITGLDVVTDSGTVSFDKTALAALAEQATGSTVTIHVEEIAQNRLSATQRAAITGDHADDLVIEVTAKSGGVLISNYNSGQITVTVPYLLKTGETAEGVCVWHLAPDGTLTLMECTYDVKTKTVSFVTDHLSDFIVGYDAAKINPDTGAWDNPFTDVSEDNWFYEDVALCHMLDLVKGTSDTTFSPYATMTRGMIVTILHRLEDEPAVSGANPFDDVAAGKWYTNAVIWAADNKIVEGYGNGKFGPEEDITREQMAVILYRYEQYKGGGFVGSWCFLLDYLDAAKISDWADEAMHWCVLSGIIQGWDGYLMPEGKAERCQAAAMLIRFLHNVR